MLEYNHMVSEQRKWMLYLLGILFLGLIMTPYKRILFGLLLGGTVSFINMSIMQKRIRDLGKSVIDQKVVPSLGLFLRFLLIALTVIFALKFDHLVHTWSTLIGLLFVYIVIPVERFFSSVKEVKELEEISKNSCNDPNNE